MQSKPIQAALVFGVLAVSFALLLSLAGNFFSHAQGTTKITGTIVLTDSYEAAKNSSGAMTYAVSLPGSTACKVKIADCTNSAAVNSPTLYSLVYGAGFDGSPSSRLTEIGNTGTNKSFFTSVRISDTAPSIYCQATAYENISPGTYILMPSGCTKNPVTNSSAADCIGLNTTAYYNLSVAYECT